MNKTIKETNAFCDSINLLLNKTHAHPLVAIAPSYTCLQTFKNKTHLIKLMAQNVSENVSGAMTSQVSVKMLKDVGVEYCLVGHSEVRQYLKETNEQINKKINMLFQHDIIPVLCVGETLKEYDQNQTKDVLSTQLDECLKNLDKDKVNKIIIAYEPVWAIGTNKTPTKEEIEKTIHFIKHFIFKKIHLENINVLYGGSVNEVNAHEILNINNVDGVLVGGASLDPNKFYKIINNE